MIMHLNNVHHVTTIARVAADLGEDEGRLWDVASEMEIEDGLIWVYGIGEDGFPAFTDFGIENKSEAPRFRDTPRSSPPCLGRKPSGLDGRHRLVGSLVGPDRVDRALPA
jgi:hypothetical protein